MVDYNATICKTPPIRMGVDEGATWARVVKSIFRYIGNNKLRMKFVSKVEIKKGKKTPISLEGDSLGDPVDHDILGDFDEVLITMT